jgi:catechol 2,3-dioxygenase-like lactoylglutathione lyase family enzyme
MMLKVVAIWVLLALAPAALADYLGLTGIGVKDLEKSKAFYHEVLGMQVARTYELGYLNEIVMVYPEGKGGSLVLMNWPNDTERVYDGNNVKLVFEVADPAAIIEKIRSRGLKIDREAGPIEALPGAVVALARDPDNYVVELLKR